MRNIGHTGHMRRVVIAKARNRIAAVAAIVALGLSLAVGVAPATADASATDASAASTVPAPAVQQASSSVADTGVVKSADLSKFKPGNIISDGVFFNGNTMSAADIQSFLNGKVASCQSGYVCLKDFRQTTRDEPADAYCSGYRGGANETAATIIAKVAASCGVNPQVLLVTLQKEQALVTHTWPSDWRYKSAMGQGCPDTAACDSRYYGFQNQVYGAARQFKIYAEGRYFTWYAPGKTWNIQYHPSKSCGSSPVYIENKATAGLYYYTPYQPNAAALRAGYGEGDGCSSYGNRNFYQYFQDWFGSTQDVSSSRSPFGGYNLVVERGRFTVQGWAIDPDQVTTALKVSLTVDGVASWGTFTANWSRPDVGRAYPGAGDNHGMNASFDIQGGDHTVCVTVKNVGAGVDANFGCATISVETASPHGGSSVEAVAGGVRVTGWTLDMDTKKALAVHVYIDGVGSAHTANAYRPDVGRVFPGFGDNHGIDVTIPTSVGKHNVCVYGINVGRGTNSLLGCHDVAVTTSGDPKGAIESVVAEPGGLRVIGWAFDPNTSASIDVHIYRGSRGKSVNAAQARKDLSAQFGNTGVNHGFEAHVDAPAGRADVCAYGINVGIGTNALLGCAGATVMSGSPFGGMDTKIENGSVRLRGWTIDPDTTDAIAVHVYVDDSGRAVTANASRPDVGRVYPGYGSVHGIDAVLDVPEGRHTICAYGINVGAGGNALLGCEQVDVPNGSPFGGTDVTVSGSDLVLRGWTIDPDTAAPIDVHVYVDGVGAKVTKANKSRPDVERAYPAYGAEHGIATKFSLAPGRHQICSYGINVGRGTNALLACQTVDIR